MSKAYMLLLFSVILRGYKGATAAVLLMHSCTNTHVHSHPAGSERSAVLILLCASIKAWWQRLCQAKHLKENLIEIVKAKGQTRHLDNGWSNVWKKPTGEAVTLLTDILLVPLWAYSYWIYVWKVIVNLSVLSDWPWNRQIKCHISKFRLSGGKQLLQSPWVGFEHPREEAQKIRCKLL